MKRTALKLTISLIRCKDKTTVWSDEIETFDNSVFSAQDRTSTLIGQLVGMPETGSQGPQRTCHLNQEALRSYEKGKRYYNRMTEESLEEAIHQYNDALIADPNFTLAYAALANAYSQYVSLLDKTDSHWLDLADRRQQKPSSLIQISLKPITLRAGLTCCAIRNFGIGNPEQAKREVLASLEIDKEFAPSLHWLMSITADEYYINGDKSTLAQAIDYYNRANQLDPNYLGTEKNIGLVYAY